MNKVSILTIAALLTGGLATATYAVQGQTDTGGASGQASPSTPNMGSSQDTDTNAGSSQRSKKSKSTTKEKGTQNTKPAPAPPVPQEGSNPSLDPTGKGSTSGG